MTDTQHGGAAVCCQPRTWHSLNPGEGVLSHKINVLLRSGWISLIEELASCAPELIFFFCFILCVKKKSLQEVTASRAWHVTVDARGLLKINSAWWTPSVPQSCALVESRVLVFTHITETCWALYLVLKVSVCCVEVRSRRLLGRRGPNALASSSIAPGHPALLPLCSWRWGCAPTHVALNPPGQCLCLWGLREWRGSDYWKCGETCTLETSTQVPLSAAPPLWPRRGSCRVTDASVSSVAELL